MSNYYFLAVSLPELKLGHPPDISFEDYARTKKERDVFINIMVGDLQRIIRSDTA